jgi:hypothetical protein
MRTRDDHTSRVGSAVDSRWRACWCGQELDGRQSRFCPALRERMSTRGSGGPVSPGRLMRAPSG